MAEDMDFNLPDEEELEGGLDDQADYAPQEEGEEKNITSDGGVKKLLVKAGEGWEKPETGDDVSVHYTGTLLDGKKFDSSVDRNEPFTFKLGQGQVIKGWDKGVATMKKGEKAVFTIAPEYAYGKQGSPPTIPPDATLKFEVELLSWKSVKDICGDGGIFKTVLTQGKKWETPKLDDEALVKYEAKLSNGTVFAKSPEEGVEFFVKDDLLCPAVGKALKTMHKGEKVQLTVKPQYGFAEAGREAQDGFPAVPPNETITIGLELVSWKTVEKVTDDGKVMKKILQNGEGYEKPEDEARVKVRYTASLLDGTVFEQKGQEEGQEFEFVTDEEEVLDGLDRACQKMKKGEKALITVSPEYAFKEGEYKGPLATVPPNSTVQYEVEMVAFDKDKQSWDMDNGEKLEAAAKKKEAGNALYKAGKYRRAAKKYGKAVKFIEFDSQFSDEEKKKSKALQVTCNLNDAACKLKLKEFAEAAKLCSKVLEQESQNVKALYRRAQAYIGTQDFDLAEWDIKKALEIDPNNRDVKLEYRTLKQKVVEQNKKEAKLFGNMFDRLRKIEEKEVPHTNGNGAVKEEHKEDNTPSGGPEPMAVEPATA